MPSHRISLSAQSYARLSYLAAIQDKRPNVLLDNWINDQWDHRDDLAKSPPIQPPTARPKGTFSDSELDQIRTAYQAGKGPAEISRSLGRHKSSVSYAIGAMRRRGEI